MFGDQAFGEFAYGDLGDLVTFRSGTVLVFV